MTTMKLLLAALLLLSAAAAAAGADSGELSPPTDSDSAGRLEVDELRSKISALESSIADRAREVKGKDETISQLEKSVSEKSASIVSLQGEIELSKKKGEEDAEEIIGKVHRRASELEKEVQDTRKEIETQKKAREDLDARASEAEKKVQELNLKVESLEKKNEEQKRIIQKIEHALKVAEEDLLRTQLEATSKSKELIKVHGAWLPPWLANFLCRVWGLAVIHWNDHGKPAVNVVIQKVSEKSAEVHKLTKPHLERVKTKWIPIAKEQWVTFMTHAGPYVDTLSTRTVELYDTCRSTIAPHAIKVQEIVDPYFQKAKESTKPHIDQIATFSKPHVEKVRAILKPYTAHLLIAYGEFLKSAALYHQQAEVAIHEKLLKHEMTKALATKESVWFMASALLALPVFILYRIFSVMFCKKLRQSTRNAQAKHTSRRPKRRYADK